MTNPAGPRALEALRDATPTARQAAQAADNAIRAGFAEGPEHVVVGYDLVAVSVCPVCDERFPHPNAPPQHWLEQTIREHAEAHTPREYLEAIARLNTQIAELRARLIGGDPPPPDVDTALAQLDAATETYRQALEAE
ncbi:MAG TPA: hypothetical protein VGL39_27570 [Jatrophihabitantaceae bacterium]|jgi:hypothetical protein